MAISLTNRANRSIVAGIETAPSSPKPPHEKRSPAQSERHASLHDAALFLGGDRRLLLLLTSH
jgi:hypothetical protein